MSDPSPSSVYARTRAADPRLVLIGIDDTDNLESRGTGWHVRRIAELLIERDIATPLDVTRHQLLVDPRVRYTSHNSSLCLLCAVEPDRRDALLAACRDYLVEHSAPGSDAGLCIAPWSGVPAEVEAFGRRAKVEVLRRDEAEDVADRHALPLEGLTGDHGGKIGALAAIGLRRGARDGRIVWRRGLREVAKIASVAELIADAGIDEVRRADTDELVPPDATIDVRPWPRAVMVEGRAVLLVEKAGSYHDRFDWQLASKLVFRAY